GELRIRGLPAVDLPNYWPAAYAPEARKWIANQVTAGAIESAVIRVTERTTATSERKLPLTVEFDYSGATIGYFRALPLLVGARGKGRIEGDRFEFSVEKARAQNLDIAEGKVTITDLFNTTRVLEAGFVVRGRLNDALTLLDGEPLRVARTIGINPAQVGGTAAARVRIGFPMTDGVGVRIDQVDFAGAANLAGVSVAGLMARHTASNGNLKLRIDRQGLDIEGDVAINGVPTAATWREDFRPGAPYTSQYLLAARLGDDDRRRLGIDFGQAVRGPVDVKAQILGKDNSISQIALDLELKDAELDGSSIHWRKAAGVPGNARATMSIGPSKSIVVDTFALEAGDLRAYGSFELTSDGSRLSRMDITRLAYGENLIAVSIRPHSKGIGYVASIAGERFDFSPYLRDLGSSASSSTGPPIELSLNVKDLWLGPGRKLDSVRGGARSDGKNWFQANFDGGLGGNGKRIRLDLRPTEGAPSKRTLTLKADDGGAVLKVLGFFDNAVGGDIEIDGTIDDARSSGEIKGTIRMRNFRVAKVPTLARILTYGSFEGIVEGLRGGEGINFVGFDSAYTLGGGALALEGGRVYGPPLAITVDGSIGTADEVLKLEGAVIPAYTFNSLLGNIPILGNLFVGRKGEGVFALSYKVLGTAEKPDVQVNPLSALTPGILRRFLDQGPVRATEPQQDKR
ncbi:MAG: hypothetical protein EXQ91_04205, partial [Alphaproteobacteria bacterium]|nr:hypothetical protein [Alphaproteobacteria bacterium]